MTNRNEYMRKWRKKNKDKVKRIKQKCYQKNKEKNKQYNKKYYQKNKEKLQKNYKKYYQENKEKIKEKCKDFSRENIIWFREWREENREKLREFNKKYYYEGKKDYYYKENPEKIKAQRLISHIHIPKDTICCICDDRKATDKHHEDYNKPFEYWYCCRICHNPLDKQRRLREEDKNKNDN